MEQYKIRLSILAENDLRDTALYIAKRLSAPMTAFKLVKNIKETTNKELSWRPQRFRLVDNDILASMGFRRIIVKKYLVFFIVEDDENIVSVERIIHGTRNWESILLGEKW